MWTSYPGWSLLVSAVFPLLIVVIFAVYNIVHGYLCSFLVKCFGRPSRVWWRHIAFMKMSEGWKRQQWMSSHGMGCLLKEILMIIFMYRIVMYWIGGFFCSSLRISMVIHHNTLLSLFLADVSTLNFIPVSMVVCTHLRDSVLIFMN